MQENNTIKTYKDYIPAIQEKFPYLSTHDIQTILTYGFRMLYLCNLAGCDTLIVSQINKFWFYIGELTRDSVKHFEYYRKKLYRKIKFIHRRIKPEWDGWYYTYITEEEYKETMQPKRGRPRRNFSFKKKISYKSLDACRIRYNLAGYIIKYKYPLDMGFSFYLEKLNCKDVEVVSRRDNPLKFEDVLTNNNKYNYYEKGDH